MTLKLSMKHFLCKYYQSFANYDPGLMGKSENYLFFLETIAALGLKVA